MNDAHALLSRCQALGAELFPTQDGKLKIRAPEPLPDSLQEELRAHKPEILRLLAVAASFSCPSCGGVVTLEQPDPSILPTRLWQCSGCSTWGAARDGAAYPVVWVSSATRQ
jgi:hypothetical protein